MKTSSASALLTLCLLVPLLAGAAAPETSVVRRRWALAVGSNDGKPAQPLRHAITDARAFSSVMTLLGGVRPEDARTLANPTVAQLLVAIDENARRLQAERSGVKNLELVFYFSGHADEEGLWLKGERLPHGALRSALKGVPTDFRIVVLDACAAGSFSRHKGGQRISPFLADESMRVTGEAVLASSAATEASQESDRLGGSFFTHHLLSGLRGAADTSADGKVTLDEAYRFAFNETLARTERTAAGAQHPTYEMAIGGAGEAVITDLRSSAALVSIAPDVSGRIFIRNDKGSLLVELAKRPGIAVELGLEEGTHQVTITRDGEWWGTTVRASASRRSEVVAAKLQRVPAEENLVRGALRVETPRRKWRGDATLGGHAVRELINPLGQKTFLGGELGARYFFTPLLDDGVSHLDAQEFLDHPGSVELNLGGGPLFAATAYPWLNTGFRVGIGSIGHYDNLAGSGTHLGLSATVLHYWLPGWRSELTVSNGASVGRGYTLGPNAIISVGLVNHLLVGRAWRTSLALSFARGSRTAPPAGLPPVETTYDSANVDWHNSFYLSRRWALGLGAAGSWASPVRVGDALNSSPLGLRAHASLEWQPWDWLAPSLRAEVSHNVVGPFRSVTVLTAAELRFRF